MSNTPFSWRLRDLPFVARLVIAVFLCSVGVGYFAALVQVHMQHAPPGELFPGPEQSITIFHGQNGTSTIERLVTANEALAFSASGSMRSAFTTRSAAWPEAPGLLARETAAKEGVDFDALEDAEQAKRTAAAKIELRKQREGEADALAHWIHNGLAKKAFDDNRYPLPDDLRDHPITEKFLIRNSKGEPDAVKINDLINKRCARCHSESSSNSLAKEVPLSDYWQLKSYADPKSGAGGMSMQKLAQTTHVHLLSFSMLYFLTGLLFAMTRWPGLVRLVIAPIPLLAQFADVSFWWLARLDDPYGSWFAQGVGIAQGILGLFLAAQIILTLFSLFGKFGKLLIFVLIVLTALGGRQLWELKVKGYLASEVSASKIEE